MKLLLDENLPHALRNHLVPHEVFTVAYMGWCGMTNGALLDQAARKAFEVFITMDNGVAYQQNPGTIPLSVVTLSAPSNDMSDLLPLVPRLLQVLDTLPPRTMVQVR